MKFFITHPGYFFKKMRELFYIRSTFGLDIKSLLGYAVSGGRWVSERKVIFLSLWLWLLLLYFKLEEKFTRES